MEAILLNATLEEKDSKKGAKYYCIEIELTPTCKKQVFLEPSEVELVKLYYSMSRKDK